MDNFEILSNNLSVLKKLYDSVRIVDPLRKKLVVYTNQELKYLKFNCYSFWKSDVYCSNCVSMRAYNEDNTFVKIEYNKEKLFMVMASPINIDNDKYVIETLKDITNTGVVEDFNAKATEKVASIISGMNNIAIKDELTKIYNRRFINERIPVDILKSISLKRPLSIIMTDIDFFKSVNDNYGHLVGDFMLLEFASLLEGSIKKDNDWVARYGGEEFIIVLDNTDSNTAYDISEKIRKKVEEKTFECENNKINITSSFGIYTLDEFNFDINMNSMIKYADENLYKAKKSGRNKSVR